jgi:hypothetical protein
VDDPFAVTGGLEERPGGVGRAGTESARRDEGFKGVEHPAGEGLGEGFGGHEVAALVDPSLVDEAPAGDEAVQVRVVVETLAPGVEEGKDAEPGADLVAADVEEGGRGVVEEGLKGLAPSRAAEERAQGLGQGKDHVEVGDGQEVVELGLGPEGLVEAAAGGTVAVAAGVVGEVAGPAAVAVVEVPAESARATGDEVGDDPLLGAGERHLVDVVAQDLGDGELVPCALGAGHLRLSRGSSGGSRGGS